MEGILAAGDDQNAHLNEAAQDGAVRSEQDVTRSQ